MTLSVIALISRGISYQRTLEAKADHHDREEKGYIGFAKESGVWSLLVLGAFYEAPAPMCVGRAAVQNSGTYCPPHPGTYRLGTRTRVVSHASSEEG